MDTTAATHNGSMRAERAGRGKSVRAGLPRSSLGEWKPASGRRVVEGQRLTQTAGDSWTLAPAHARSRADAGKIAVETGL